MITFGYTDRVPTLMAASDVVITSSGDTCREARVIGRRMVLSMSCRATGGRTSCTSWSWATPRCAFPRRPRSWAMSAASWTTPGGNLKRATTGWGHDFVDALEAAGIALWTAVGGGASNYEVICRWKFLLDRLDQTSGMGSERQHLRVVIIVPLYARYQR